MLNFTWNSWGASVAGPAHIKAGVSNQDSWLKKSYTWGNVVVVSDGLGSKPHADHGSKQACHAVLEAAKIYQQHPQANIVDILRLIHAHWRIKIAPFTPAECGATCLFAIQFEKTITLGRLGDGMIAVYGQSTPNGFLLTDNKQDTFTNYTYCLQQEFTPHYWQTATIESTKCDAIVLCTDGISEDLVPEKKISFAQELYLDYKNLDSKQRGKDLKRWLNEWPVPGHSDDKTIACLFKKGVNT